MAVPEMQTQESSPQEREPGGTAFSHVPPSSRRTSHRLKSGAGGTVQPSQPCLTREGQRVPSRPQPCSPEAPPGCPALGLELEQGLAPSCCSNKWRTPALSLTILFSPHVPSFLSAPVKEKNFSFQNILSGERLFFF